MDEAWMTDPLTGWSVRFHKDHRSWSQDPYVFLDTGKAMADASPPLLKDRRHLRRDDARKVWKQLAERGWKKSKPAWGVYTEP